MSYSQKSAFPSVLTDGDTATVDVAVHDDRRVAGELPAVEVTLKDDDRSEIDVGNDANRKSAGLHELKFSNQGHATGGCRSGDR